LASQNLDQRVAEVVCDVVACGSYRASAAELPALRKSPGNLGDEPIPNGLLRHSDEQTVVGLAAVLSVVRQSGLDPSSFGRWSVLAAPRFLGRTKFEASFARYQAEGAWGVSPYLIPGLSLHSPSGTISQVLHAQGANLGIGGTPGGEREALLIAGTWLEAGWTEGVWLVLTGRDPEDAGEVAFPDTGDYRALALALVRSRRESEGLKIRIRPEAITLETSGADQGVRAELLDWLKPTEASIVGGGMIWRTDDGHDHNPSRKAYPSPNILRNDRLTSERDLI